MALPSQLLQSFTALKTSALVAGDLSKSNVRYFVDTLNHSIPSSMNPVVYAIYRFNRTKYINDRQRFMTDITGFAPYEAMVLWTDFKDILAFFNLTNKIFLGWDKTNNRYRGFVLNHEPPQSIRIIRKGHTLKEVKEAEAGESTSESEEKPEVEATPAEEVPADSTAVEVEQPSEKDEEDEEDEDLNDMNKVYDSMHQRIAKIRVESAAES